MVRIPTHRTLTHPGEMLLEELLKPMGITQRELSNFTHVSSPIILLTKLPQTITILVL